jgi:methionyl aminopeptidase
VTSIGTRKLTVELKSKAEIAAMRRAGQVAGRALQEIAKAVAPGITTRELDRIGESAIRKGGGIPTFIGYRGYPASICVSVNEEVVHGIPGPRKLKAGDVVGIDIAATVDGFVGDTALTVIVPPAAPQAQKLVDVTKQTLDAAIEKMRPGNRLGDIGAAVQALAEANNFGVIRDFVGHGIGRQMHEEPAVPNFGAAGTGMRLEPGVVLAIEPMITAGDWRVKVLSDGWTVVTEDGSLAAHFEHTIAVTPDGPLVLTKAD